MFSYPQAAATPLQVNKYFTSNPDSTTLNGTADKLQADSVQVGAKVCLSFSLCGVDRCIQSLPVTVLLQVLSNMGLTFALS